MSRGVLIAGNWKMNYGPKETEKFLSDLRAQIHPKLSTDTQRCLEQGILKACLIPPSISLERAASQAHQFPFPMAIAAQNAHWEKKGAYTGEVSGPMLQELGIQWVLIGHSERRQFFGETNTTARLRAESLLEQGFHVILCLGESREERESGKTEATLTQQLAEMIPDSKKGIASFLNGKLVLAYEPIWAIGTGLTATPDQAEEAHRLIRNFLRDRISAEAAHLTPLLYGGSVTPENSASLLCCPNIDGALVGGASLKLENFVALLNEGAHAAKN